MRWDGSDAAWRKRPYSPFFRIVNPELYAKPNLRVGIVGTAAFFLIIAGLMWQKHSYEKQQLALHNPPKPLDRTFTEDD